MAVRLAAERMWRALGGDALPEKALAVTGEGGLPSCFAVTDLAAASMAVAALAAAELAGHDGAASPAHATIDRRLAAMWFRWSIRPQGWERADPGDPFSGEYATRDGWIRLHTSGLRHRSAARSVLGNPADRAAIGAAVAGWDATALETAIVDAGGCAAELRSVADWALHPQGRAIAAEPLFDRSRAEPVVRRDWRPDPERPLAGLRVLDLTRILAGPISTRFLAGFGAEVLRIDPPGWDEPGVVPEVTLGKRCARLDLGSPEGRNAFEALLRDADVLVHGLRPEALERLGLGASRRRELAPGLVDVTLDAYGWTGPWARRRGFDSLVQMSGGIAEAGMRWRGADRPVALPVPALDHATGYLMAAAAVRGITERLRTGQGSSARLSLARTAHELVTMPAGDGMEGPFAPETAADLQDEIEQTSWGPAARLRPAITIAGVPMRWDRGARALGTSAPAWG